MLRGRNTAVGNVFPGSGNVAGHGLRRCTIGGNNALTSTFGPTSCVTPGLFSGERAAPHPGDARLVPKSAEAGGNVAATSRRRTRTGPQHFRQHQRRTLPAMEPYADPGTEPVLGWGHYTVVLAGAGHRTLEVAGPDFRARSLIVSYLCGPGNESNYRAFTHITAGGDGLLWHRFREDSTLAALVAHPTAAGKRWRCGTVSSVQPAVRSMRRCGDV
jgi:hypothetical protein